MTRLRGVITSAVLAATACALSACVASEASRYQETLSSSVQPSYTVTPDVALAFGLSDVQHASVNLAAVREKRQ